MVTLDFTLDNADERRDFINKIVSEATTPFSDKELELMANYMLYGKEPEKENTNTVNRKEIDINTKYGTYRKKSPESLESLMEIKSFNEESFNNGKIKYRSPKTIFDREKHGDIPGMRELWQEIDRIQHIIDVNCGKTKDENVREVDSKTLYRLKHWVIDLRRHQYYLRDYYKPTMMQFSPNVRKVYAILDDDIPWDEDVYTIAPLGVKIGDDKKFIDPLGYRGDFVPNFEQGKFILDFRKKDHIYYLFTNYDDLLTDSLDNPESTITYILQTLDFYAAGAKLSPQKQLILEMKKEKRSNEEIRAVLAKKWGVTHTANYISTIWKQQICGSIADFAALHFDYFLNRANPAKFKVCNRCGKIKLIDNREFVKKSKSSDGFSGRCKECDKELRKGGK